MPIYIWIQNAVHKMQQSLASYSIILGAKMCYVMKAISLEVLEALPTSSTYIGVGISHMYLWNG